MATATSVPDTLLAQGRPNPSQASSMSSTKPKKSIRSQLSLFPLSTVDMASGPPRPLPIFHRPMRPRPDTPSGRSLHTPIGHSNVNLYPIEDSPDERVVENDMIDIGFYASIGYPINRSLAMNGVDGSIDEDGPAPTYGPAAAGTPRNKVQNRNAAVMPSPQSLEAPRQMQVPSRKHYEAQPKYSNDSQPQPSPGAKSNSTKPSRHHSRNPSYDTERSSLPALQDKHRLDEHILEPLGEGEAEAGSYDLVAPNAPGLKPYSLEERSELLFGSDHLRIIFSDPTLLLGFTAFMSTHRQDSVPILIYYLDAIKALKAISYANAIVDDMDPINELDFTHTPPRPTQNALLEEKVREAFEVLVNQELPAYITHVYIQTVSLSISMRIAGTLPIHLRQASEGLAEVFCLTDPSRPDNPIVFASEEFHRTTQYGMNYVIGRNCRFLQGPRTNLHSVGRFRKAVAEGKEHVEVFLNYRRDGSPFMNLLMFAPLRDSRGTIRYFIGAQIDVSGLVKECSDLDSLKRLVVATERGQSLSDEALMHTLREEPDYEKSEFQELTEMMNMQELETVRRWGGRMHRERVEGLKEGEANNWNMQRILIQEQAQWDHTKAKSIHYHNGTLNGVYENYLLVRPYPSLKILFASPSMRVPGILQSPFMAKIGGSPRVREELTQALADGRGVTAKIRWVTKQDTEGRSRWIHCTALLGSNGAIGVWMVVIIDDDKDGPMRRYKQAPRVDLRHGQPNVSARDSEINSLRDFAIVNGGWEHASMNGKSGASSGKGSFVYTHSHLESDDGEHSESGGYRLV